MSIEEQLKAEILSRYRSVRAFTTEVGIPYSTLDSVFKRGIENAGIGKMLTVFDALDLDIESIQTGKLSKKEKPALLIGESSAGMIDKAKLYDFLVDAGYVDPGCDLSDSDARFIATIGAAIDAWFANRK